MRIKLVTIADTLTPQIRRTLELLKSEKARASNKGNEEEANNHWRHIEAIELQVLFIQAFHNIKLKNYRQAWYELEQCKIKENHIRDNSSQEYLTFSRLDYIKTKISKWQSLYPYRFFCSPGFKVGYYTCCICGHKIRPRSRCEHKKGKVYNGELCVHQAHDIEMIEMSFVTKPIQKYSVMHDDSTLNFTLLQRLSSLLDHAFEDWDIEWTTIKHPIVRFKDVSKGDKCPCRSNNTFEACCMGQQEIEVPHVNFLFSKPKTLPKNAKIIAFPYNNA